MLAKHRRRALVHAVPLNPRTESNRRLTGFVVRCLSAWLRGHDTASSTGCGPPRHPILAHVAPRRRLRVARLAVNARLCVISLYDCRRGGARILVPGFSDPCYSFSATLRRSALAFQHGGVGVSRTRSSPSRLIDVAGRRLTVRPPLRMRSRRDPSHAGRRGAAPIARAREAAQRAAARARVPRKSLTRELRDTIRFSKDALNQTYTTVHARKLGVTDETRTRFARFTRECLDRFGFDHQRARDESNARHAVWNRDRRQDADPDKRTRGPAARRSPRRAYKSFGAVMMRRCRSPGARRRAKRRDRRGNSNPRTATCGLRIEVERMRIAAS